MLISAAIPEYALVNLLDAAIKHGANDEVGAAIAHIQMLCRQQGLDIKELWKAEHEEAWMKKQREQHEAEDELHRS